MRRFSLGSCAAAKLRGDLASVSLGHPCGAAAIIAILCCALITSPPANAQNKVRQQPIAAQSSSTPQAVTDPTTTETPALRSASGCAGAGGASIAILLNFWGPVTQLSACYDFNHDGSINSADLSVLLSTPPDPLAELSRPLTAADLFHLYKRAAFGYVSEESLAKALGASADAAVTALFDIQPDSQAELRALEWKDEHCCNVVDPVTGTEKNPGSPKLPTTSDGVTLYALVKMGETLNPALEFLVFRVLHELVTVGVSAVNRDWADMMLMIRNEYPGQPTRPGYFDLLRSAATTGDYPALIKAITKHPAMLRYLNGDANVASQPNQNYARELMELFTLGPTDPSGNPNYNNADIGEAARALTGLQITETTTASPFYQQPYRRYDVASQATSPGFDPGTKVLFAGTNHRCSAVTADDLVDCIFNHPAAATYLATQIGVHYVRSDIASAYPEVVAALAEDLKSNRFNILATIKRLLRSEFFYRAENRNTLLRSPFEKVIHVYRALRASGMHHMLAPCGFQDSACYALCPGGSYQNCSYFADPQFNAPLKPSDLLSIVTKGTNRPADPPNVFAWRDQVKYFASTTGLITFSNGIVTALSHYFFNNQSGSNSAIERWNFIPSDLMPALPTQTMTPPLHVEGSNNYNAHRDDAIRYIARLLSLELNDAQLSVAREFMDSLPAAGANGTYSFNCVCAANSAINHPEGITTPGVSCVSGEVACGPNNAPWNPFLFNQRRKKLFGLFELLLGATEFNT